MAEHGGGKDPISGTFESLFKGAMGIFGGIFVLGAILGGITGNAPIRASLFDVWAWGQMFGAWINAGGNSGIQTFGDEKYFQNSKKIGSDSKPDQRLMSPSRTPSTILPTSTNNSSQTLDVSATSNSTVAPYQDLNGDGVIDPKEIEAQNKAKR